MEPNDRRRYLTSKLETTENIFNLRIPIQENHIKIFNNLASNFRPASKITDDIKEIVTRKDFNLCRDKVAIFLYKGSKEKLKCLQFYCFMNFITNWTSYDRYISTLVPGLNTSLTFDFVDLSYYIDVRFRNDNELLSYYSDVDILYLHIGKNRGTYKNEFYYGVASILINSRNDRVTVIDFSGNEFDFNKTSIEEDISTMNTYKIFNLFGETYKNNISISQKNNHETYNKKKTDIVNDEEVF